MRTLAASTLVLVLVTAAACAPKTVAVPVVTAPKFPEFVRPEVAEIRQLWRSNKSNNPKHHGHWII